MSETIEKTVQRIFPGPNKAPGRVLAKGKVTFQKTAFDSVDCILNEEVQTVMSGKPNILRAVHNYLEQHDLYLGHVVYEPEQVTGQLYSLKKSN